MNGRKAPARAAFGSKETLTADLERTIRDGSLPTGHRLQSERELGLAYKLSRPVVREVLSGLAERGYIEISPGRGSFVRAAATTDLARPLVRIATSAGVTARNLVEAREMIECAAVLGAVQHADEDDVDRIFDTLAAHENATGLQDRMRTDLNFHLAIADVSGNPVLATMYGSIRVFVEALMLRSHSDPRVHAVGDPLHREIAGGIRARRPDAAVDAMRRHVGLALDLYGADLDQPLTQVLAARGIDLEAFM